MLATSLPLLFCLAIAAYSAAQSSSNDTISVDDTSPVLKYSNINDWTTHVNVPAVWNLYDSSDTFSSVQGAWVSFSFNGTTIEYWGNQGPYHGPCLVTLEDGTSTTVNSHNAVNDDPIRLFYKTDLSPGQTHTIKVTVVDPAYPNVCELDRFVYTPLVAPKKKNTSTVTYVAIGAGIGGALVIGLVVLGCVCWRRRSNKKLRARHPTPGQMDVDYSNNNYNYEGAVGANASLTPFPAGAGAAPLSHSASILSSPKSDSSNLISEPLSLPTPFPFTYASHQPGYHPVSQFPPSSSSDTSNEKRSMPWDASSEGSSAYQYGPLMVQNPPVSPPPSHLVVPSGMSSPPPSMIASSSSAPYQHQDAGRVAISDEIPPAYKDAWSASN